MLFTFRKVKLSFSPAWTDFTIATLSPRRGAESNAVTIIAIVVVATARGRNVIEIVGIIDIRRAKGEVSELNLYDTIKNA